MNQTRKLYQAVGLILLPLIVTFSACGREEIQPEETLTNFQLQTITYFQDVALGFENGGSSRITRKWFSRMKLFIGGNPADTLLTNVQETVDQLNELATDGFSIEIVQDSFASNAYLYFGKGDQFIDLFPDSEDDLGSNLGLFYVWWNNNYINRARMFVDTDRTNLRMQKSLIMEELTQALGMGRDSPRYPESIFYETSTMGGFATEFAPIDREVIRLLYHPDMDVGLNASKVEARLRSIFANE